MCVTSHAMATPSPPSPPNVFILSQELTEHLSPPQPSSALRHSVLLAVFLELIEWESWGPIVAIHIYTHETEAGGSQSHKVDSAKVI